MRFVQLLNIKVTWFYCLNWIRVSKFFCCPYFVTSWLMFMYIVWTMLPDHTMMMSSRAFKLFSNEKIALILLLSTFGVATLFALEFQYLTKSMWSSDYDVINNVIVNWISACEFSCCPNSVTTLDVDIDLWESFKLTWSYQD